MFICSCMRFLLIFLYLIIYNQVFVNTSKAEDITISSNQFSQIVMSNNDTLTVQSKDRTINSVSEAYYINNPSEIHSNSIGDQNSGHLMLNLGIGAKFKNNLTINTSFEHYRGTNDSFNNNFSIYVRKSL